MWQVFCYDSMTSDILDVWVYNFSEASSFVCNYTASDCYWQVSGILYFGRLSEKTVMLQWNSQMSLEEMYLHFNHTIVQESLINTVTVAYSTIMLANQVRNKRELRTSTVKSVSQVSIVRLVTRLQGGQFGFWILAGAKDLSVLQNVQTSFGDHLALC